MPDAMKIVRGTFEPARARTPVVPPLEGAVGKPPAWLKGEALRLWRDKVATYTARGQNVVGCESTLAQYCQVEADLIGRWRRRVEVPVALINAFRILANEFFDTPASQQAAGTKKDTGNRFARNAPPAGGL